LPGASPLPDELAIGRALRPLARRLALGPSRALDEEATAVRSAEMGFPFPVFRVATQAYFEAALVVEDTPSMAVWDAEARRFAWLLAQHRAFHDARLWRLRNASNEVEKPNEAEKTDEARKSNKKKESKLRVREASSGVWRHPRDLCDAGGRRLIILLTDGVSKAWRDGLLADAVREWGRTNPVVVCQTLGERLWRRTFLGEPSAAVKAAAPARPNAKLNVELPWWERLTYEGEDAETTSEPLPLPVITLDPQRMRDWARMLMRPGATCPAFLIDRDETPAVKPATLDAKLVSVQELDPAARIRAFREMASPQAYELAIYLSAMPLTLSIMRLVQKAMFEPPKHPKQEHLAEVLLGGIVQAKPAAAERATPDPAAVQYEFHDGVRELLERSILRSELDKVFACVSDEVNAGRIGFDFAAWVGDGRRLRSFARVSPAFLRKLGCLTPGLRNSIGMEFVSVLAGNFIMGSSDEDVREALANAKRYNERTKLEWFTREQPQHRVTIVEPFYLGKYQVTQWEWAVVMGRNPSRFKGDDRLPVEQVSWDDCQKFIQRLNARKDGYVYRLPSEAEWEYACRAGTKTAFSFGETITPEQVNYDGNYPYGNALQGKYRGKTTWVGSFPPNAWGLHDMHGNVLEWCQDGWHENYNGASTDGRAWEQGSDNLRVLRGGSWNVNAHYCRSASRFRLAPSVRHGSVGLRVVVCLATN
jgi:formylglycine-generating enzyme required for sulfatase activity